MRITSKFADMTSSSFFFLLCLVSLVKFSYWSKFHVNIITVSRVMTIFFYKGLTTNTPVWVLHNIWRLRQLKDTKFDTNVSNEMLLNSASQLLLSYSVIHLSFYLSFYCFSVIKGKPRGGRVKLPLPPPPRLRSIMFHACFCSDS